MPHPSLALIARGPAADRAPADAGAGATVARLAVTDFRCYARAVVEVDPAGPRAVVLTGPNGAGKTNLLEAVSFLAPGRGLRGARIGAVDRRLPGREGAPGGHAGGSWAVAARLCRGRDPVEIGTGRDPAAEPEAARARRIVKIDGTLAGQAGLAEVAAISWLTPQMDRLFLDGAGERRRFLDRMVFCFDPAHAGRVSAYEQAMRERMRLLKGGVADAAWLAALEGQAAAQGVAVAAARRDLVARLDRAAAEGGGPFPQPAAALDGAVEAWLDEMPALAAEDALKDRLAASRARDAEAGSALWGPHRSDLAVRHRARAMPAAECSTGEQKALLIALVLAHARLQAAAQGAAPILLLDEVAAHLDLARRRALFDDLVALGAQVWLTGTDEALFADLAGAAQFFRVRDAAVAAA
ncbi:MAG: DNA replication and repair protein RecF [Alphaproteobacteria bacterium]|nr:MAG: DNA replication and repair protein RecF [Alphaproteobacteria bacterium]